MTFSAVACLSKTNPSFASRLTNVTMCDRGPPRYGKKIPLYLLPRRDFSGGSSTNNSDGDSSLVPSGGTPSETILSVPKEDRGDCPLCKKYSKGPCGELFKKWLECLDKNEGNEINCDVLMAPLDKCLKKNEAYYDKISLYDDNDDEKTIEKWKEFIEEMEGEATTIIRDFDKETEPEMQLRLERQMGAAMFRSKIGNKILLLAYVKDQDGNILGAGSSEELYSFQGQLVLKFGADESCKDVIAHGLYGNEDDDDTENDIIIFRKMERMPSSTLKSD